MVTSEPETTRFTAVLVDDTRQGVYAIHDSQVFDDRYILLGITREQAEFGAFILNNEGVGNMENFVELQDEIADMVAPVECIVCEKKFMAAQMHDQRCPADQP